MCSKNLVKINGRYSKPSKTITPGDIIEIETLKGVKRYKVLDIPTGNVTKDQAHQYYEEC